MTVVEAERAGRMPVIPGAFSYHRPTSVQEAVGLLAKFGDDGRALAGGHSLIPMMKLRLATPAHLVDLAGIADLKGIRGDGGDIVIGAMTTQHELIGSELLAAKVADPARDLAADRRPAGALFRHARRQCRQRRSRQRHAGGDDVPRRHLSRRGQQAASAASRRATSIRAPFSPRWKPASPDRDPHSGAGRRPRLCL